MESFFKIFYFIKNRVFVTLLKILPFHFNFARPTKMCPAVPCSKNQNLVRYWTQNIRKKISSCEKLRFLRFSHFSEGRLILKMPKIHSKISLYLKSVAKMTSENILVKYFFLEELKYFHYTDFLDDWSPYIALLSPKKCLQMARKP